MLSTSYRIIFIAIIGCLGVIISACTPEVRSAERPTKVLPTAIAKNPMNVWIDNPLPNTTLLINQLPEQVVAHASGLSGTAQLQIYDDNNTLLGVVDLGAPQELTTTGGQLSRYSGDWLPVLTNLLPNLEGTTFIKLTVSVDGVTSEPVLLLLLVETDTPTPSPTITPSLTVTSTDTPLPTNTHTATPTHTATSTLTMTATMTSTLTPSPSPSSTLTFTATSTQQNNSNQSVEVPDIPYFPKPEVPCEFEFVVDQSIALRVGPGNNRGIIRYLTKQDVFSVVGYNDDAGLWWQIQLEDSSFAWIDDAQVTILGSCMLLEYVPAPDIINRPPPTVVIVEGTLAPTNTLPPGVTPTDLPTLPPGVTPTVTPPPTATVPPTAAPCFSVSTSVSPINAGSVSLSAPNCGGQYTQGTVVNANASPAPGNIVFSHWSGSCVAGNPTNASISFTITANCSLTANFMFIIE